MMDPISVTAAALVATALNEFATEAGKRTWAGLSRLVSFVRGKFAGDDEAAAILDQVEQAPTDQTKVDALAGQIDGHVASDPAFQAALRQLVQEAEGDPMIGTFVTKVSGNAHVGKVVNIADVRGNVTF